MTSGRQGSTLGPMSQTEGPLRAARIARGWSQSRAAEELVALAAERGVAVAAPPSLKTQLSRWENQHALPEEHYRALLRELYRSTDSELGLVEPTDSAESAESDAHTLRARLAEAAAIDAPALELLREQLRTTRALDDQLGGAAAIGSAQAQLSYLEGAMRHALVLRIRRELAALVVSAATLCGRLALDHAKPTEAWRYYETAKASAREATSPTLLGYATVEQASVLIEIGEQVTALSTVEQAISMAAGEAPSPLRAWFEASRGEVMALSGAVDEAHAAYRSAERELSERPEEVDIAFAGLPPLLKFDLPALRRRRGHARRLLHEDASAIEDLRSALRDGGGSARELAGVHIDLAWAHNAVGQPAEAATHARSAREIATRIGSVRLAAQLDSGYPRADLEPASRS